MLKKFSEYFFSRDVRNATQRGFYSGLSFWYTSSTVATKFEVERQSFPPPLSPCSPPPRSSHNILVRSVACSLSPPPNLSFGRLFCLVCRSSKRRMQRRPPPLRVAERGRRPPLPQRRGRRGAGLGATATRCVDTVETLLL